MTSSIIHTRRAILGKGSFTASVTIPSVAPVNDNIWLNAVEPIIIVSTIPVVDIVWLTASLTTRKLRLR